MKILITGPQGCGKTTQAKILAEKFGLCFINTGDLLRELATQNTDEGMRVRKSLEEGKLVDDSITADVVRKELEKEPCQKGIVMDGFPRRMDQLKDFDPHFDKVFYLDVPEGEVIKRLLERGRPDDKPEIIKERLRLYYQLTEPVLNYYNQEGILTRIDASQPVGVSDDQSIQEIAQKIEEKLRG